MSGRDVVALARETIEGRKLAAPDAPVLLMVSGGSDSMALLYAAAALHGLGALGPLAVLHVNHQLRGEDADADARFVEEAAALMEVPFFLCSVDVAAEAQRAGENVEAVARRERYLAANEALASLCRQEAAPLSEGRIFTAHTADDRVESFYMRSIVGTGPGGFRAMRYRNGPVARPLLDASRADLRAFLEERAASGLPAVRDRAGALWREDATNAHTDRFRAYVRHEIVPRAQERNPQLLDVLCRTMNLIADEDDLLEAQAAHLAERHATWVEQADARASDRSEGCVLAPALGAEPRPLVRRVVVGVLGSMLGPDARIEAASVEAVLAAWDGAGNPRGGYVANIQGDLAVSANKRGVRLEPMSAFRARRKRR